MEQAKCLKMYAGQYAALKSLSNVELGKVMKALFKYCDGMSVDDLDLSDKERIAYEFMVFESENEF